MLASSAQYGSRYDDKDVIVVNRCVMMSLRDALELDMDHILGLPELYVPIQAGGHSGCVWWNHELLSYGACVDVFDFAAATGSPVALSGCLSSWDWLSSTGSSSRSSLPPQMMIGTEPGQFLTVDSLSHELTRKQLPLDSDSWASLLGLRQSVAQRWGELIIRGRQVSTGDAPFHEIPYVDGRKRQLVRLEILNITGARLIVRSPTVVTAHGSHVTLDHQSNLDVARSIVSLVWGSASDHAESVVWELALEILAETMPFSLVAASVADWIASGDGLRQADAGQLDDHEPTNRSSYRQLVLNI